MLGGKYNNIRIDIEKPVFVHLVRQFLIKCETWTFFNVFTRAVPNLREVYSVHILLFHVFIFISKLFLHLKSHMIEVISLPPGFSTTIL
jgi:hypothetical protein